MATTVDIAFKEFNKNIVNLLPNRTSIARSSRDWLFRQLNNLDNDEDLKFPFKYEDRHIRFGSFARNTKIRELDDIDLMFCLNADGAIYSHSYGTYTLTTHNAGQRLKNLSDNNTLNSRRVVNKLTSSLSGIEHYKLAELHSRGEATTLSLNSYEWNFDIVPCFYTDTGVYLIPDGTGNWKATDPRIDQKIIKDINITYDSLALQLIRTLKYWNRHHSSHTIPSYLFEQFILNYIYSRTELQKWIDLDIRDFFGFLSEKVYSSVPDRKELQGNLNTLSFTEQRAISEKAIWAYNKAKEAVEAELQEKNIPKAIFKWREIFGSKFPTYD